MAAYLNIAIISLIVLFPTAFSQPPRPTLANCVTHIIPLSPCAPFVQGTVHSPADLCCVNLKQVYTQQPSCLCLLLNGTTISNMPINTTLALQLPDLCRLRIDVSTCPGLALPRSNSSAHGVSSAKHNNSTIAASPTFTGAAPEPFVGLGLGQSAGIKFKTEAGLIMVAAAATFLFTTY